MGRGKVTFNTLRQCILFSPIRQSVRAAVSYWLAFILVTAYCLPAAARADIPDDAGISIEGADALRDFGGRLHDLDGIIASGRLRVLYQSHPAASLSVSPTERAMLERFAREYGITLEWQATDDAWQLLPRLAAGEGDIIIGQGKSLAAGMQNQALYTLPWISSRQQVVVRTDTSHVKSLQDLAYRQVALKTSSPSWTTMQHLASENPTMGLIAIPEHTSSESIMSRVSSGEYDVTIADSDFLKQYLPQHPELTVAYDLEGGEARSWAVNKQAEKLQNAFNQFLNKHHLEFNIAQVYLDDLPAIEERKILRLITYNNPNNYYFSDGRFHGFEYELIRKFARDRKMRVDVVLASSYNEMQKLLLRGEGDVIAAALPRNSYSGSNIRFSEAYNYSSPVVIGRKKDSPLLDVRDLAGRRIILSAESPYLPQLRAIRDRGIDFDIVVDEHAMDTDTILSMVAGGMYDLTVISSNRYNDELSDKYGVRSQFALSEPLPHGLAVRSKDTQLLAALNDYIKDVYRSRFYNTLYAKYIERRHIRNDNRLFASIDKLSPYDELVRKFAEKYSFDWRLIVAQMYQESRFNPDAISHAGAEGLMQIMPETAAGIGVKNMTDPAQSIEAGVRYLNTLRGQFENDLLLEDRTWFTLASYNAGYGRINSARKLASDMGLDPDKWFGNVEKAMLMLAEPVRKNGEIVHKCRCGETVAYVQEIRTLYNNYVRLTQAAQVALNASRERTPYGS